MSVVAVEETYVLVQEDEDGVFVGEDAESLVVLVSATAVLGGTVVSLDGVAQTLLDIDTSPVTPADIGAIPTTEKAANSGVATLDSTGDVPLTQLAHAQTLVANAQTISYTAVLADESKVIDINSSSALTFTVPPNASVAFAIGTVIHVCRIGTGTVTITPGAAVTLPNRVEAAGTTGRPIASRYGVITLRKRATNEWVLTGDLT